MQCPKCNKEGSSETECSYCGVVFRKYQERPKTGMNHPVSPGMQLPRSPGGVASSGMERGDPAKSNFKSQAARASWVIVLINFGVMQLSKSSMEGVGDTGWIVYGGFVAVLYAVGIILGIIGMTGWRQLGAKATLIPGLAGTLLNAAFLFLVVSGAVTGYTNYTEKAMVKMSESLNKQLPKIIDNETRLDKTSVGPGKRFSYAYTLINYRSSEINRDDLKQNLGAKIRDAACAEKKLQVFFKKGITIFYSYSGNDGVLAFEIPVGPSDCGSSQ